MKIQYWISLFTYWFISNASAIGIPLMFHLGVYEYIHNQLVRLQTIAGTWGLLSNSMMLIIIFILQRKDFVKQEEHYSKKQLFMWLICGVLACLVLQIGTSWVKHLFGAKAGSENTASLIETFRYVPLTIVNIIVLAPILEELVFRFIIFKQLNKRFKSFIPAALISSILFALVHNDLPNIVSYIATGYVFSFLFHKTKRIWVSMVCHMALNCIVMVLQFI